MKHWYQSLKEIAFWLTISPSMILLARSLVTDYTKNRLEKVTTAAWTFALETSIEECCQKISAILKKLSPPRKSISYWSENLLETGHHVTDLVWPWTATVWEAVPEDPAVIWWSSRLWNRRFVALWRKRNWRFIRHPHVMQRSTEAPNYAIRKSGNSTVLSEK